MLPDGLKSAVIKVLQLKNICSEIIAVHPITDGLNHHVTQLITQKGNWLLKYSTDHNSLQLLEKELHALQYITQTNTISIPRIIHHDSYQNISYLLLEYIERGAPDDNFWKNFAQKLAALHSNQSALFGWHEDNYIGSLKQCNKKHKRWSDFFTEERILPQIKLARDHHIFDYYIIKQFEKMFPFFKDIFPQYNPSLIHGDLWHGNFICSFDKTPYLIDPAIYYGHPEVDIAMTTLFGNFHPLFYHHYSKSYNLMPGWKNRIDIYNLYPLLVHVNLFGGHYITTIKNIVRRF